MSYKVLRVVEATEVPDWERKPPKWAELLEAVKNLKPNQSLEIEFESAKEAERARNAVRDHANLEARAIVVRTRMVEKEDDKAIVYFTKVNPVPQDNRK